MISRVAATKTFDSDPAEILRLVQKYDCLDEVRAIAGDYAGRARAALVPFAESPAKEALEMALDFVLDRDR